VATIETVALLLSGTLWNRENGSVPIHACHRAVKDVFLTVLLLHTTDGRCSEAPWHDDFAFSCPVLSFSICRRNAHSVMVASPEETSSMIHPLPLTHLKNPAQHTSVCRHSIVQHCRVQLNLLAARSIFQLSWG
jgi:hypothetical protein